MAPIYKGHFGRPCFYPLYYLFGLFCCYLLGYELGRPLCFIFDGIFDQFQNHKLNKKKHFTLEEFVLCLYNSLTKKREEFRPKDDNEVKMYVCGPTVYGYLHIGNFRGAVFFNLVANWLKQKGYKVTYAYNYTDIDDKIIKRAKEEGVSTHKISEKYIKGFEEDFERLGLQKHDHNPKATDFISQIIDTIERLIEKGKAYRVEGEVFYSVDMFERYGNLSGKKPDDLNPGQRVEVDKRKKNPLDFSLWKTSKEGEPWWESPWGNGRPGWHIECTAMIQKLLGGAIEIHGGGMDLIFPHHENEIAQGEGCDARTYCRYWMHNNLLNVDNQKMSKSLGNIISARAFMDQYHPEILKYLMLSVHYRRQLNLNEEKIEQIITELFRIYSALCLALKIKKNNSADEKAEQSFSDCLKKAYEKITQALDDDFNTSGALSQVFEVVRSFNALNLKKSKKSHLTADAFIKWMKEISKLTALFGEPPYEFIRTLENILLAKRKLKREQIDEMVAKRCAARQAKDFAKADQLRQKLDNMGIEVHDEGINSSWEVKRN